MKPRNEDDALRRSMVARRTFIGLSVLLLFLTMAVVVYAVTAIRDTQQTNAPKIDNTAQTLKVVKRLAEKINSCVDPEGGCAQRGQRQTAAAVGDISLRQVAAVACADRPGTQTPVEIKTCVDRTLRIFTATRRTP